jgi:hypothetical protein
MVNPAVAAVYDRRGRCASVAGLPAVIDRRYSRNRNRNRVARRRHFPAGEGDGNSKSRRFGRPAVRSPTSKNVTYAM